MNRETVRRQLPSLLLTALFLLAWELFAWRMNAAYILPSPTQILRRTYELRKSFLLVHLPVIMMIVTASLLLSLLLGIFLVILMGQSKMVERAPRPLLVASQTISITALAPLFVPWLGYGIWSKVLATVFMTFSPTAVTLSDGFRAIPPETTELVRTPGAVRWQLFRKLKFPVVLSSFFTAIRMVIPPPVIGAATGEWLGAQAGLDYFSRRMMAQLNGMGVFAPIMSLSVAAMLLTVLARQIETRALKFRNHQDSDREETRRRGS